MDKSQSSTPHNITPVILAGGKGLRLRPLTSISRPKPLVKFFSRYSFLQKTIRRVPNLNPPIIICEERYTESIQDHLAEIECTNARIIAEPEGKSTAAAIILAATLIGEGNMIVLPCDHAIKNEQHFESQILPFIQTDLSNKILICGLYPNNAATRYGYIEKSASALPLSKVLSFKEKPDINTAQKFLDTGNYLWNTGIFLSNAAHILTEMSTHAPSLLQQTTAAIRRLEDNIITLEPETFSKIKPISIDHALMEKTNSAYVVQLPLKWSDTGTWDALLLSKFGFF